LDSFLTYIAGPSAGTLGRLGEIKFAFTFELVLPFLNVAHQCDVEPLGSCTSCGCSLLRSLGLLARPCARESSGGGGVLVVRRTVYVGRRER
jgi:hypothetical protein